MLVRFTQTVLFLLLTTVGNTQISQNMNLLGNWNPGGFPTAGSLMYNDVWGYVDCSGNEYAIMGGAAYYHFIDITNPSNPVEVTSILGGNTTTWRDMKTYSSYAYGVCDSCNEGLAVFDLSDLPNSVSMVGQYTTSFSRAHNIFIDVDNARLYAVGTDTQSGGAIVFDLAANPANPPEIGRMSLPGGYMHDIFVRNNIGYGNSGNNGLWVYDFSNLNNVTTLGNITSYPQQGYNHAGWVTDDNTGYVLADETHNRSLKYLDVSDLSNITTTSTFRSELLAPAVTGSIAHNPFIRDNYAIVSYYHDGLQVFDISDPSNVVQTAWYDTYTNHSNYSGYAGNWGAYPFLPSGNILASDEFTGLYILQATNITFTPITTPPPPTISIFANGDTDFCEGGSVDLNAIYSGFSVQWYKDGVLIPDANSDIYTATEAGVYYATTANSACSVSSSDIEITIIEAPDASLNVPPFNQICDNQNFQITAPAGETSYTWTRNGNILPQNSNSITVNQAGDYQVEVSNGACSSFSIIANLIVEATPDATLNINEDQEICEDQTIDLSVAAGADTYQWLKDNSPFAGNTNSVTISESGDYRVIVTNGNCTDNSETITVTSIVYPDMTLNNNGPIQLCNEESDILTIPPGAEEYIWYKNNNEVVGTTNIINIFESGTYFVEASNGNCTDFSQTVIVDVGEDPDVTLNVPNQNMLCDGEVLEVAVPSGASNYTWYYNNVAQNGETNPNYFATNSGDYYVIADINGCTSTSETVSVSIETYPNASLNVSNFNEICEGEELTISAPSGAENYQWFRNNTLFSNSGNTIFANESGDYYLVASNGNCESISETVNLTVNATPSVEMNVPTFNQLCEGEAITLTIPSGASNYSWSKNGNSISNTTNSITVNDEGTYAVTASNGSCEATSEMIEIAVNTYPETTLNVPLQNEICTDETVEISIPPGAENYQWYQNGNLLSENGNSITISESGDYQVVAANGECESTSEMVNVETTTYPNVTLSMPLENQICEGETLPISVATGAENYQWSLNGDPIANTAEITAAEAGSYQVVASNGGCQATSETLNLTILNYPNADLVGATTNEICEGETVEFAVPTGAQSYEWYQNGELLPQTENSIIASTSGDYQVVVANGNCEVTSEMVNVQVFDYPAATISVPTENSLCEGETLTISIPTGAQNYEWYQNGQLIPETTENLTVSAAGSYHVVATNGDCATISETINLTITPLPNVDLSVGSMNQICAGDQLTIEAAGDANSYQWYQNGELLPISGNALTVSETGEYQLIAANGDCSATSEMITVEVVDAPDAELNVDTENEICAGENLLLEAVGGANNYQWFLNGEMTGNNENTLMATEAGEYFVMIGSGDCSTISETINLTVNELPFTDLNVATENTICVGESLEIAVPDGADNYIWYFNDVVLIEDVASINVSQSGTYYVVANNGNCESTSETIEVTTMQPPNTSLTVGANNQICEGETLTVTAPEAEGDFQWFLDGVLVNDGDETLLASEAGTYYLEVNNGSCTATSQPFNLAVTPLPTPQLAQAGEQSICEGEGFNMTVATDADSFEWYQNGTPLGNNGSFFTVSEPGEYYVVAETNGCEGTSESVFLSVNEFPSADILTTAVQICPNETATLSTPSVGESYQWFFDFQPISGANGTSIEVGEEGVYFVSVTNNGCTSVSVNIEISVLVPMTPEITFDGEKLTTIPADSYQWFFNGNPIIGATDQSYNPTLNGDYFVQITDDNGCMTASEPLNIIIDVVQDVELANSFILYPNPVQATLFIENKSEDLKNCRLSVYNNIGQIIFEKTLNFGNEFTEKIEVEAWSDGIYFLKMETEDGRFFVRKFVKK